MSNILLSELSKDQLIEKFEEYPIYAFPKIIANAIQKSAFYHHVPVAVAAQTYLAQMSYFSIIEQTICECKRKRIFSAVRLWKIRRIAAMDE